MLQHRFADNVGCAIEKVTCNGCSALTEYCWGYDCKLVACLETKGYEYCHQCADFDDRCCKLHEDLTKRYAEDGVDVRANMVMIRKGRINEWLARAGERFTCESCGNPLIEGSERCHHCNAELSKP